ncbi:Rpn family recombination-promoting nuclease/putative transposase [Parafannyhessea umbonata]|nr:Rpn family recombination-promoting nuclease/putative transposase [Parafannyhessea umbonata]
MHEGLDFSTMGITDDFMFGTVFQDLGLCRGLVEVLLGIKVRDLRMVERQELIDFGPASRAGIVDLLVRDVDGNVYDVEMQNGADPDIARRARRYLSLVDASVLDRGQRFGDAGNVIVLFICAHDPFGRGWKRYDYPRLCEQDGEPLGDGTSIVFVNAEGTRGDFGDGFDAFMSYLRDDNVIGSDFVRSVDDAVCGFRDDPGWRRFRMLWSEKYRNEFADAFDEGEAKGKAEGRAEGKVEGRAEGKEEGFSRAVELMHRLMVDGRERELEEAMRDPERMKRLLEEYGL